MPYCEAHPYGMLETHSCFLLPNAHPYGMASYLIQQQTFPVGKTARLNLEGKLFFLHPVRDAPIKTFSKLRSEMELDVGILFHGHLQGVGRLGQEDVPTLFVLSQIQGLAHLEVGELGFVVTSNPCSLIEPPKLDTQEAQFYDISECPAILKAICGACF